MLRQVVYFPLGTPLPTFFPDLAVWAKKEGFKEDSEVRLALKIPEHLFDASVDVEKPAIDLRGLCVGIVCGPSLSREEINNVHQVVRTFSDIEIEAA